MVVGEGRVVVLLKSGPRTDVMSEKRKVQSTAHWAHHEE